MLEYKYAKAHFFAILNFNDKKNDCVSFDGTYRTHNLNNLVTQCLML